MLEAVGRLSPNVQRLLLILACIILFGVWFTRVPLTEIDETRYAEATREMLASGNFIVPHFNFQPRYQKPVLYYWVQAASVRVFGVSEMAARLPSAVIAIVLVLLVHALLLFWLPRRMAPDDAGASLRAKGAAFLGAGALATMPYIAIWARASTTDITLTFFTACALLAMLQADLTRVTVEDAALSLRRSRRWYLLAAIAAGLAFLTKGPIGLAIPGLVWLIYHGLQRTLKAEARRMPWILALLLFLAVAAPWYIAIYVQDGSAFFSRFFGYENYARLTTVMEGHGSDNPLVALLIYLCYPLLLLFPYSPFLIREALTPATHRHPQVTDTVLLHVRRFAWTWLLTVIGIFAVSKTQLPSYIQSIAPAAALLFALHLLGRVGVAERATPQPITLRIGRGLELALLFILSVAFIGGPIFIFAKGKLAGPFGGVPFPQPMGDIAMGAVAILGTAFILGMVIWGIRRQSAHLIGWTMAGWTAVLALYMLAVGPLLVISSYQHSVDVGQYLRHLGGKETVFVRSKHPSEDLVYYSHRPIWLYGKGEAERFPADLRQTLAKDGSALLVTDETGLAQARQTATCQILKEIGPIQIIRATPMIHLAPIKP